MKITLVAFGIAREILNARRTELTLPEGQSIADVKSSLIRLHPALSKLESLSFAIGEDYQPDEHVLTEGEELVIIPPVSGG